MQMVFKYGSQVYGLTNSLSDEDFVIITDAPCLTEDDNKTYWTVSEFKKKLEEHDLKALEVFFENKEKIEKELGLTFILDKSKLRRAVSATSDNSYVKAKKKINQGDWYVGVKSLWHALRIPYMFTVLAEEGSFKPSSFKDKLEHLYKGIVEDSISNPNNISFQKLDEEYRYKYNSIRSKFREACPLC